MKRVSIACLLLVAMAGCAEPQPPRRPTLDELTYQELTLLLEAEWRLHDDLFQSYQETNDQQEKEKWEAQLDRIGKIRDIRKQAWEREHLLSPSD